MSSVIQSIGVNAQTAAAAAQPAKPEIADAARQFEALLLTMMLRSMRESGSGAFFGAEQDGSNSSALGFAEEQLAQTLASQGGLGLARLITTGLEQATEKASGTDPAATKSEHHYQAPAL